jgi:hypothetical protein
MVGRIVFDGLIRRTASWWSVGLGLLVHWCPFRRRVGRWPGVDTGGLLVERSSMEGHEVKVVFFREEVIKIYGSISSRATNFRLLRLLPRPRSMDRRPSWLP